MMTKVKIGQKWRYRARDSHIITSKANSHDPLALLRRTYCASCCDRTQALNILRHDNGSPSSRCMMQKLCALLSGVLKGSTITQPLNGTRRWSNAPIRQRSWPSGPSTARLVRTSCTRSAFSIVANSSSGATDAQKRVRCGV